VNGGGMFSEWRDGGWDVLYGEGRCEEEDAELPDEGSAENGAERGMSGG
jgi:hypothetical protein